MADSLSARLFNQVDRSAQERGRLYYLRGAVTAIDGTAWAVQAQVQGTYLYDVQIASEKHHINASCTCPAFERSQEPCKHVWAALLAAERNSLLTGLNSLAAPHLRGVPVAPPLPSSVASRPAAKKTTAPNWKQQLHSLRGQLEAVTERRQLPAIGERQLFYYISPDASPRSRQLGVQVGARERKADGNWGKLKIKRFAGVDVAQLSEAADQRILTMLLGAKDEFDYGYNYGPSSTQFLLAPPMWEIVLPLMCATGRCALRDAVIGDDFTALRWDDGAAWEFGLRIALAEDRKKYRVSGMLAREQIEMALSYPNFMVPGGLVFYDNRVARLNDFGAFVWISLLQARDALFFAKGEADEFIDELLQLPRQPRLELPDELRFDKILAEPKPSLAIKPGKSNPWGRDFVHADLTFDYDGIVIDSKLTRQNVYQKAQRRLVERNLAGEDAAKRRLTQLGFRDGSALRDVQFELAGERMAKVVRTLTQEGWRVEADGKPYRAAGTMRMEIRSGVDWFDLDGGAEFGASRVSLPKLLRAIKHGESTV
ncbi:MAG TPA: SWIM zinc finger family protein, partial [Candidatus Binatus sp.]|nr:SWIM zinc finger family protein [Candidatus Binatus sp.]